MSNNKRFEWEPRPIPEGLKQIERNQKRNQYVENLSARLAEESLWKSQAEWHTASSNKAALVHSQINMAQVEEERIKPIQERPLVVDILKAESVQRQAEKEALKAATVARRREQLALAELKHQNIVKKSLDDRIAASSSDVRRVVARMEAKNILLDQKAQVAMKNDCLIKEKKEKAQLAEEIKANATKFEVERDADHIRELDAKAAVAKSLENQLDARDARKEDEVLKQKIYLRDLKASWQKSEEAQKQKQLQDHQRQIALSSITKERNMVEQACKQAREEATQTEDASLLFKTLMADKKDEAYKDKQKQRQVAERDAYYASLDMQAEQNQKQQTDDNSKIMQKFYEEQEKRDEASRQRLARQQALQLEANQHNAKECARKIEERLNQRNAVTEERAMLQQSSVDGNTSDERARDSLKLKQQHIRLALDAQTAANEAVAGHRRQLIKEDRVKLQAEEEQIHRKIQFLLSQS